MTLGILPLLFIAAAQEPEPVRVTARLVEVSVVATDKSGRFVPGLTPADFTVFDGGRKEQIVSVVFDPGRRDAVPPAASPAGIYSNRLERVPGLSGGATVILFDALNTRMADQAYARQQILAFLRGLGPEDRVALYALGRGPRVLQDFTAEPGALLRALDGYHAEVAPSLEIPLHDPAMTGPTQLDAWLGEVGLNLSAYYERDRALRTIRSLVAIANRVQRLPGRKNLIWVSGSFPAWIGRDAAPVSKRQGFDLEIEQAARAIGAAGLTVYPVDARGLIAPAEYEPSRGSIAPNMRTTDPSEFRTMQVLAERTGGSAYFNGNDLAAAFRRAAADGRMAYTLHYRPSHNDWNGKFREIRLKPNRPGIELAYRRGYFAQPDEPADPAYRKGVLDTAMWSPIDAAALGLTVRPQPAEGGTVDLDLEVDAKDVRFEQAGDKRVCTLDLSVVLLGPKDRLVRAASRTARLEFDPRTYESVQRLGGFRLRERVDPAAGATVLRVLARDVASGALGSVTIPLR